jgi:alpha-acetolactate decarboxylase
VLDERWIRSLHVETMREAELHAEVDALVPDGAASYAIRVEGRFEDLRLRSVPRQQPPYRPLAEGIEISGYHLHFVDEGRERPASSSPTRASPPPPTTPSTRSSTPAEIAQQRR